MRLAKRPKEQLWEQHSCSPPLCTGEAAGDNHPSPATTAVAHPQFSAHSNYMSELEVITYLLAWAKETNVISDLQFHSDPHYHNEVAACSYFGKGNAAVCPNILPAQLLHSLASLTLEACPHTEDMPQPHICSILVQRPNHHTRSPSLRSFHNPSSLGPAGLAEQVQKYLPLHICFKHRLLSKAGLVVEFPPPN